MPKYAHIEEPALSRADGYRTTSENVYAAHPQDGPATFRSTTARVRLSSVCSVSADRKGIPTDDSGNGGGYVFDCRLTHNPDATNPTRKLTDLTSPLYASLEDDGEIITFLESAYKLA